MEFRDDIAKILQLSDQQLRCYNRADLDGFCACYSEDVKVMNEAGEVLHEGMEAFKEGYKKLFETFEDVHAEILGRLVLPPHVVEWEQWQRTHKDSKDRSSGQIMVRYTERDGRIAFVEFLKK